MIVPLLLFTPIMAMSVDIAPMSVDMGLTVDKAWPTVSADIVSMLATQSD